MNGKAAQQASVGEDEDEKTGKAPNDDLKTADEKLSQSYEHVKGGDNEGAVESRQDSIGYVIRAAGSADQEALRKIGDTAYRNVMAQLAPYYFGNKLIGTNVQWTGRTSDDERFISEVSANDDGPKLIVSETLRDFKDETDRWYIDTPKETEVAETVEDVEVPVTNEEHRPDWMTN